MSSRSNPSRTPKVLHKHSLKILSAVAMAVGLAIYALSPWVGADVLLIQTIQEAPPNTPEGIQRPGRGLSMAEVEQTYGAPLKKHDPVGRPPITRWEYDRYSVFFESDYVLHSVIHRPPKQ